MEFKFEIGDVVEFRAIGYIEPVLLRITDTFCLRNVYPSKWYYEFTNGIQQQNLSQDYLERHANLYIRDLTVIPRLVSMYND